MSDQTGSIDDFDPKRWVHNNPSEAAAEKDDRAGAIPARWSDFDRDPILVPEQVAERVEEVVTVSPRFDLSLTFTEADVERMVASVVSRCSDQHEAETKLIVEEQQGSLERALIAGFNQLEGQLRSNIANYSKTMSNVVAAMISQVKEINRSKILQEELERLVEEHLLTLDSDVVVTVLVHENDHEAINEILSKWNEKEGLKISFSVEQDPEQHPSSVVLSCNSSWFEIKV